MAGAAEAIETNRWMLANEEFAELDRRASEETACMLGGVAMSGEVEVERVNETTLLAALQMARLGDQPSLEVVRNNVSTDVIERNFKVGQSPPMNLQVRSGVLEQNGRPLTDINRNTFEHTFLNPEMYYRAAGETKNVFLFNQLLTTGILETHDAVVFEPCPEDDLTKKRYNFFTETDSCSIQRLSVEGGDAILETALVAGKATPNSERHDLAAIKRLAQDNGLELAADRASDFVRYVVLIPKNQLSLGVASVVAMYDQAAGGTFYGQQIEIQQDYETYVRLCDKRNRSFDDMVTKITETMLAEAHIYLSPVEAIERLDYLSGRLSIERAVADKSIDSAVFGAKAARYLEDARFFYGIGDMDRANSSVRSAQKYDQSGSCPLAKRDQDKLSDEDPSQSDRSEEKSEKKNMSCPFCSAKVYGDPCAKRLSCWDCKATVSNGRVVYSGNGGSKKRRQATKGKTVLWAS